MILPDTVGLPPDEDRVHWTRDRDTGAELFLWVPNKDYRCDAVDRLRDASAGKRMEEYNRLLYVAMTRARDHLLVCGWQPRGEVPDQSWYAQVRRGVAAAGGTGEAHPWGEALRLSCGQAARPDSEAKVAAAPDWPVPRWAGVAPDWQPLALPPEPALPRPLAPSRPEGTRMGPVPPARSPLLRGIAGGPGPGPGQGVARGSVVHAMLQHLPDLPEAAWSAAALGYARRLLPPGAQAEAEDLAGQVLGVLRDPALAALFGPGSRAEQGLSGVVGHQVVTGRVDRLAVLPGRVLVADYKTSRAPPADPGAVPVLYRRQMAAYRAILRLLYPGREVVCLLVWTEGPKAMVLADSLLDPHAPGTLLMAPVYD